MNEPLVTIAGHLGGDVTYRPAGESMVANFRVACTPRRFQKKTGQWVDADTQWYAVSAWRALGENCHQSLRRGDPVVVHGRLHASTWTSTAGMSVTSFEIEAISVGHDLNRGTASFTRSAKPESAGDPPDKPGSEAGDQPGDQAAA